MLRTSETDIKSLNLNDKTNTEIRIDLENDNRSLFALKAFDVDEVISYFSWAKVYDKPSYLTIQIGENQHVELIPKHLECVNHSCKPNAFFDTTHNCLLCIEAINAGDEITFFYPSSEWEMDQVFKCKCNTNQCIGSISGAKYLSNTQRSQYRFTDFIQSKIEKNNP